LRLSHIGRAMGQDGFFFRKDGEGIEFGNPSLAVHVSIDRGLEPDRLTCPKKGLVYADSPYFYRLADEWEVPKYEGFKRLDGEYLTVTLEGRVGGVRILQEFSVHPSKPFIDERIKLENGSDAVRETAGLAMGFARQIGEDGEVIRELRSSRMTSVPFRRALRGRHGEYEEYDFDELRINQGSYYPRWGEKESTPGLGAEGWIWSWGESALLIAKHSPELLEHSVISVETKGSRDLLRFGGASLWHGDPEEATRIGPKGAITMSSTRYIQIQGGIREAYYAFRDFMDSMGHGLPHGFDPPVHWNELYDNPLWWQKDSFETRRELYTLAHMETEAAKAKELGCEALYLDPGWDTSFGSSIWPPYRLLEARKFVELMRAKYGLKVSLHMPLAVWCDATAYPLEAHRRDSRGRMMDTLCGSSPAYLKTKSRRLLKLAEAGFVFFMFDGSAFTGECWDRSHDHSLPLKRSEHCRSILKLIRSVHSEYPDLLIELHDPILGGVPERYAPIHYLHGLEGSFDEVWAFEYMWHPLEDLLSGRAISLYYYNLAYSLPLYVHIDLREDNENALEFWWYASTCRHLGVGGKHPDPRVWEAHKRAMGKYIELKRFFTQGEFFGFGEDCHLHLLRQERKGVLALFNLASKALFREVSLDLAAAGLSGVEKVSGGDWVEDGSKVIIRLPMKGRDARILEMDFS